MRGKDWWERVVALLYPPRCLVCNQVVEYGDLWCNHCPIDETPLAHPPSSSSLQGLVSPLVYGGGVQKAVWILKEQSRSDLLQFFAQRITQLLAHQKDWEYDWIVPVPMNPEKEQQRGFNHAAVLAKELGSIVGREVRQNLLFRVEGARVQHHLSPWERWENAQSSYGRWNLQSCEGKSILLVDDVYTTGATLEACGAQLLAGGAARVYGVTACYTKDVREEIVE